MQISIIAILAIVFLVMLAVLGHGAWHHGMVAVMDIIANLFAGAHVSG
ncbi:MAG TPA: hypothetical protein VGR89_00985 [Puia sp.]|nr:hypothetical protein [Puia sp.]